MLLALALLLPRPALAQEFPKLTGRVVDVANIIPDDQEARLTQKLADLEAQSRRQLVIATVPSLQGYEISDYGYQLGRAWGLGDKERNDGALLLVAPAERKVRIEVGYGLEPVLTDGLSSLIIANDIVPRFKAGDMAGGIEAGTDAIIHQLALPPAEAQKVAQQAEAAPEEGDLFPLLIFGFIIIFFVIVPILRATMGGSRQRYQGSGVGPIVLWSVLDALSHASSSSGGGGGGGGFSGGGGSFGGGGASGSW
ncbi:TPM domain-containing protein [Novosphingobium sp. H3SJ31-1]|uniref:TPM domain-containing protein n=1 Tax=Novosphingobium album (ex Liu et al. 2023) TaxID=3031130 RepID=A0ABT5WTQ5_9SPHN|nr:TPM domain-containing protein [Novosphingobium album (ex Liu et al. 2023)]MDE8653265.1 TPM domain-containing protein [Novosphingobium album (ex Liu et al. 2023)]